MFDGIIQNGGILMPDPYNGAAMIGVRSIFDHMVLKDCYEAGLMSEDEWKSYLKRLMSIATGEDNNNKELK